MKGGGIGKLGGTATGFSGWVDWGAVQSISGRPAGAGERELAGGAFQLQAPAFPSSEVRGLWLSSSAWNIHRLFLG